MTTSITTKSFYFKSETLKEIVMKEVLKDLEHNNNLPSPESVKIWWDNKDMYVDVVIEVVE
jgi:hypothetical protein